jgi:hypothetical protein
VFCEGDCNGDQVVTIDEVVVLVDIALGEQPVSACPHGATGPVNIANLVKSVSNALYGCVPGGGTR